jgi:DNA replication and repair protein RecF
VTQAAEPSSTPGMQSWSRSAEGSPGLGRWRWASFSPKRAEIGGGERLELHYEGPPDDLAAAVYNSRGEDLRRGSTSLGPHRDDIRLQLDGREARSYASQGQQRTAAVSLKLAEAALIARRTGERPLLLLDDVLSELDGERRAALLREVAGDGQVIITSVETGAFPAGMIARAQVWNVEEGRIQACG